MSRSRFARVVSLLSIVGGGLQIAGYFLPFRITTFVCGNTHPDCTLPPPEIDSYWTIWTGGHPDQREQVFFLALTILFPLLVALISLFAPLPKKSVIGWSLAVTGIGFVGLLIVSLMYASTFPFCMGAGSCGGPWPRWQLVIGQQCLLIGFGLVLISTVILLALAPASPRSFD